MNLCLCGFVNSVCSPSARIRKEGLEPISIKHVSLTIRIFNIAGRFETCPYDYGNVAQNGRHILGSNVFVQFLLHKCAFLLYIYPLSAFESMRKCHFFTFVGFYMQ